MHLSRKLLWVAVVAYVISLVLPTVQGGQGIIFAMWGFMAFILERSWAVVWLANPTFIVAAWLTFQGTHPAYRRILAIASVAFALFALTIDGHGEGHDAVVLQYGYWVWLASTVLLLVSTLLSPLHKDPGAEAPAGGSGTRGV